MMISATGKSVGLTFIEILVAVVIISILIAISLPNFRKTFNNLELNNISLELQTFMNYLRERSIVETKLAYLNIDNEKKEYWAQIEGESKRLRTYHIPKDIKVETEQKQIIFYPDGSIDKVTVRLSNINNQAVSLTTKGVFGGVKLQAEE